MSGSKQHFIPQSLLKGFGFKRGKSTFVVAYTHDHGIFTPATEGIAAERFFYSELRVEGADETLDDQITNYEKPLARILADLRALAHDEAADSEIAAALVTHLAVRNDNFRKAATSASTAMIEGVADQFASADATRALLGLDRDDPDTPFAQEVARATEQYRPLIAMLGMDDAMFRQWALAAVRSNFDNYHREIKAPMNEAVATMLAAIPGVAADAQRKSLGETLAPAQRIERMAAFHWRVVHPTQPVILSDCVAMGTDIEDLAYPLMLADLDKLKTIFLPLAADRLLVGSRGAAVPVPSDINVPLAGCSWDFFVARDRTPSLEALRDTLRSRVASHLDGLVDSAISDGVSTQGLQP
ncbi:hypothetical protein DMC47_07785 [Nostoc sp. 3335mG]|nr:hypothetical protein DMC47_07785 [Nostoc sp. 3335mG]